MFRSSTPGKTDMMHYPDKVSGRMGRTMNFCRATYVRRCETKSAKKSLHGMPFVRVSRSVIGRLSFHRRHCAFLVCIKHSYFATYETQEVRCNASTVVIVFNDIKVLGVLFYNCGR